MMKLLIWMAFGMIAITSLATMVSADTCSIKDLCYNQDMATFCAVSDTICSYHTWGLNGDCEIISTEDDNDGDGWTNSCDAFVDDRDEWVDFDADGIGHNEDCDDLDENVGTESHDIIPTGNETPEINETINVTTNQTDGNESNKTMKVKRSGHPSPGNVGEIRIITNAPIEEAVQIAEVPEEEPDEINPTVPVLPSGIQEPTEPAQKFSETKDRTWLILALIILLVVVAGSMFLMWLGRR